MNNYIEKIMKKVDPKKAHCHDINSMRMTYSSWDRKHFGIKNGTKHIIYRWKAYSLGNQKIHVNTR